MHLFRFIDILPAMKAAYELAKEIHTDHREVHLDNGTAVYIHQLMWAYGSYSFGVAVEHSTKMDAFGDPIIKKVEPHRIQELAKILATDNVSEKSQKDLKNETGSITE